MTPPPSNHEGSCWYNPVGPAGKIEFHISHRNKCLVIQSPDKAFFSFRQNNTKPPTYGPTISFTLLRFVFHSIWQLLQFIVSFLSNQIYLWCTYRPKDENPYSTWNRNRVARSVSSLIFSIFHAVNKGVGYWWWFSVTSLKIKINKLFKTRYTWLYRTIRRRKTCYSVFLRMD